jgi:malonyl-CoA/methylmalonyl-CoA synthetase
VLLEGRGTLAGERVALLAEPGAPFVEALYGIFLAGGCAVVLSPLHPAAESLYFCTDAQVRTVLVEGALAPKLPALPSGMRVLKLEEAREGGLVSLEATPQEADPALQIYTSGTTGKPKGAVLTHANLGAQQAALGEAWGMRADDVLLHCLPLHHVHGLSIALLNVLGAGGCARFVPYEAGRVWETLGECTVFMAVPTIYAKLMAAYDAAQEGTRARWARHAQQLRLATSGSAALPVGLAGRWRELTGRIPLERFGMTEIGVALSNPLHGERRAGSVGWPLPGVEVRVVDDAGQEAQSGELWVRGPSVFPGYHRREDATRAAFAELEGVRYFRTGDTVVREADGCVRILGRTSVDILKSGGYKLSALELEELLREHPAVGEVAVVGVPDEVWGDRVVACVVPRAGQEAQCTEDALRAFAKERVAAYKVPKQVVLLPELPRNAMGKVVKPELVKKVPAP